MNWPTVRLGEVSQFIRGITFKPDDVVPLGTAGSIACFRTKNVQTNLDISDVWAVPNEFVKKQDKVVKEGDLILSTANSWNLVGKASWVPKLGWEATFGGFVSLLRADVNVIHPRYLYHWITTDIAQSNLRKCARQTTNISNLNLPQALDLKIPLPPLEEQKRIAGILDQADALRRLRTRALDKLNTLGQAIFHEMFGDRVAVSRNWPKYNLADLILDDDRINYGVVQPGDHDTDGIPIIRVADLAAPAIDFDSVKRISKDVDANYARSRLKGGEILIGCVGSIGTTMIAPKKFKGANIARAVARVAVDPSKCNPEFVAEYIRSDVVQRYFQKEVRLVAQPTLNIKQIRETEIVVPPAELQAKFLHRLNLIKENKERAAIGFVNQNFLFASLQHRAFRGEL